MCLDIFAKFIIPLARNACFNTTNVAAAEHIFKAHDHILSAEEDHIKNKGRFKEHVHYASDNLTTEYVSQANKEIRRLCEDVALPEIQTEAFDSFPNSKEECTNLLEFTQEEVFYIPAKVAKELFQFVYYFLG